MVQSTVQTANAADQRMSFIGRVQEQRQFLVALQGLLAHQRRWLELAQQQGLEFDPAQAPGDESYASIFLPHGIGGIGKSWLTRRCLDLAMEIPTDPPLLTLYDDMSLGAPVLEPVHLLDRLHEHLLRAGYELQTAPYRQAKTELPAIVDRVTRYQFENRQQWDKIVEIATNLVARREPEVGYRSFATVSIAYIHAAGAETAGKDGPTLAQAYDLLLEQMQTEGKIKAGEAALFRNPPAAQAARLAMALSRIAVERPLVIGLDNLEIVTSLEPLIRDCLVLPTTHVPMIWILSGRYNLADERLVEIGGEIRTYKGYRDLLGENPPVVWDMSIFGDADLRDYLMAEAERRRAALYVDEEIIEVVKTTSSGVPLVVEMVADALFTMDREEFLRDFALHEKGLLPDDRLEKITERFLRYCLTQGEDLERVQGMAMLHKGIDEPALAAVWNLSIGPTRPPGQSVQDALRILRSRYAFVMADGLHDAVYEFVRRQLHATWQTNPTLDRLSRRAVHHYRAEWEALQQGFDDPALRMRDQRWQRSTRNLLNALLWYTPDEAVLFLIPRFVEGLGFDRSFANGLLNQAEEFLAEGLSPFSRAYANLLHRMRVGMQDIDWTTAEPGEAIGPMLASLLQAPGLAPLHLSILHLWQGNWLVENGNYDQGLAAYLEADRLRPEDAAGLGRQLSKAFYELSSRFLWPVSTLETIPSEKGLQAARRAVELDAANGAAWFNLGVALDYTSQEEEAVSAYQRAIQLEPRPNYYNNLGDIYSALGRDDEAIETYWQALAMDPAYAWPYHNLGQIYAERGEYQQALNLYRQAIQHHRSDKERAISWDEFGDIQAILENYEEAISAYRWAGVLNSNYASPWYGLGNVYMTLEQYPQAIEAYQHTLQLDPDHAWAYHKLGLIYTRQGDYDQATGHYRQAVEHHADDQARALSWRHLGDLYLSLERYPEALEAYRLAIELDPDQAGAWNSLGDTYRALVEPEAALQAYRRAVQLDPNYALAWRNLADIYRGLEQYDEAIAAYRQALTLNPDDPWPYHHLGSIYSNRSDYRRAIAFYEQAVERQQEAKARALSWRSLGDLYVTVGDRARAVAAYQQAIALNPDDAWPHHHLAALYEKQADHRRAIDEYRQAIERHTQVTDRAASWQSLADLYHRLARHEEAIRAYREVITLEAATAETWNSLGDSYGVQSRPEEAGRAYHQAIALDPGDARPYYKLGLISSAAGDYETALNFYRQAIDRQVDDQSLALSWTKLGDTYLALAAPEEAAQAYHQAIQLGPDQAPAYHGLAVIHEQQADYKTALDLYQQAIARYPAGNNGALALCWNGLGNIYRALSHSHPTMNDERRMMNDDLSAVHNSTFITHHLSAYSLLQEAIQAYRRAAELDPSLAAPWNSLGDIYRSLGQYNQAIQSYQQAIDRNETEPQPYHNLGLVYEQLADHDQAITHFQQALARYSEEQAGAEAASWNHLGHSYQALARSELAIDAYQQAIKRNPAYAAPWDSLGTIYAAQGQSRQAINAYYQAIERDPRLASPWAGLGNLYQASEQYQEAIEAYNRAVALAPDEARSYYNLGAIYEKLENYDLALSFYQQAISRYPKDQAAAGLALAWNGLGNVYRAQARYQQAINAYHQAIKLDPAYVWPYHSLGLIYSRLKQYDPAIAFYRQAIDRFRQEQRPERAIAWNGLGEAYHLTGRIDEAIAAYRQATDLDNRYALPWYNLGNIYRTLKQDAEAGPAYRRAIELDPTHAWSYNNLGLIHEQEGNYKLALELYQQAIDRHVTDQDRAVSWHNLGNIHFSQKQAEAAQQAYQQAIKLDPAFARPWNALGDVYRARGQDQGVVEAYQRAIELEPTFALPYHNLASFYKGKGAYMQAIAYYKQAIDRYPPGQDKDRSISWNGLGNIYRSLDQYAQAIEAYQKAIEANSDNAWPYHNLAFVYKILGNQQRAAHLYQQAIERFDSAEHKAVSWNNLGNVHNSLGQSQAAIEAYQQAINLNSAYPLPWNNLGETYSRLNQKEQAVHAYREAIKRDPGYLIAWSNLGDSYRRLGRFEEAIPAYEQAIAIDPSYVWPYHNLGLVYEERADYESALKAYQEAIKRHQNLDHKAILWDRIGNIYRLMRENEQAIEAFRLAIGLDPAYAAPWYSLGNIFAILEQDEEAMAAYRRAIELNPADPWPYHNLALVYEKREAYNEAIAFYRQAIERHSGDRDKAISWDSLGNVYSDVGRSEEAIQSFQQAIELKPDYAPAWNSLGDLYQTLGNHLEAVKAYRRAIALDPDYAWPYNNLGLVYETMGEHDQAIAAYKEVINRHTDKRDQAISWSSLGDIYGSLRRETEAIAAYEQAILLDPDYSWPYNSLGAIYEKRGDRDQAYALYQQATRRHRQRSLVV